MNVEIVVHKKSKHLPTPPRGESTEAFMSRLRAMIERHGIRKGRFDDSRESIYAGCGE